uniref:BTB/POZ domain-containing protein 9 n=1 Tax=Parascaris univalens TaxID=6257 RepID=A0A915A847_PARUN
MSDNHPQLHGEGSILPVQSAGSSTHSVTGGSKIQAAGANGEIQHVIYLAENIGTLYNSADCSDVMLKVEGVVFPAHRVILAARSEYFRALLFNGMRETRDTEVELVDTPVNGFKMLLKYIYTGKLSLSSLKEELVLDILGLAHKYGFSELELSISEYLKAVLNVRNMCTIYDAAHLYSLWSLSDVCLNFADKHASEVLSTQGFLQLSASAVELMIQRDSLCAPEIDIFRAVREWVRQHPQQVEEADMILAKLRLPLMKLDDLLNVVRPSGLLSSDAILDAIKEQQEKKSVELTYRGFLLPDVNVATVAFNASVLTEVSVALN